MAFVYGAVAIAAGVLAPNRPICLLLHSPCATLHVCPPLHLPCHSHPHPQLLAPVPTGATATFDPNFRLVKVNLSIGLKPYFRV